MNHKRLPRQVTLHIEELILDGVQAGPGLPAALEWELARALSTLVSGGATPSEACINAAVQQSVSRALLTSKPGKESL